MKFENNLIYHVFNQGNNHEQIFLNRDNYLFFLQKMRVHLSPHVEMLCYCLMPNHFHWLFQVKSCVLKIEERDLLLKKPQILRSISDFNSSDDSKSSDELKSEGEPRYRSLNESIAILLRSYTRAINLQENRSGSLFRPHTKAKTGWIDEFITVDRYRNGNFDFRAFPDDEYGFHCFHYIHENPKRAGLCSEVTDWEFSSARDFAGLRNGTICNQNLAKKLLLI